MTPHESLQKQTPHERFHNDEVPLRFPENFKDLEDRFVLYLNRRVSGDHIVKIDSTLYEMPRGYAGARVQLHRRVLSETIHFLHEGRLIQLHPVDLHGNARERRAEADSSGEVEHPLPASAADLHFQRDMKPIVDPDGGFSMPPANSQEGEKT